MSIKKYNFRVTDIGNDCLRIEDTMERSWTIHGNMKEGFLYQFGNSVTHGSTFVIRAKKIEKSWCEPVAEYDVYDLSRPLRCQKVETDCRMSLSDSSQLIKNMFELE